MKHIVKSKFNEEAIQFIEDMINKFGLDCITRNGLLVDNERTLNKVNNSRYLTVNYDNCYTNELFVNLGFQGDYKVHLKRPHDLLEPYNR
ncbi:MULTISPECIES: hypothetical protein [Vibrio harveyi group]|uniref:hypothetical protein n=1 Tax=Vibrio harveyi group TaxID=717610 RepID=UPI000CE9647A|nr:MULTISPECIES: hypothetical protein [Vibrio harveyi group]AVF60166.1 hypothetical protein AL537_12855 [Vibrio diabolicus]MCR9485709.1 hypothetical protein [Vibrio alginolyticus]MCS0431855.1 hypothetical protein [Vibrio diabolicus]